MCMRAPDESWTGCLLRCQTFCRTYGFEEPTLQLQDRRRVKQLLEKTAFRHDLHMLLHSVTFLFQAGLDKHFWLHSKWFLELLLSVLDLHSLPNHVIFHYLATLALQHLRTWLYERPIATLQSNVAQLRLELQFLCTLLYFEHETLRHEREHLFVWVLHLLMRACPERRSSWLEVLRKVSTDYAVDLQERLKKLEEQCTPAVTTNEMVLVLICIPTYVLQAGVPIPTDWRIEHLTRMP